MEADESQGDCQRALVNDDSFETVTGGAVRNHPRMADREVALRFIAFRLFDPDDYAKHGNFDEFLGFVTERLDNPMGDYLDRFRRAFAQGMANGYAVFGEHAFRKWSREATRKSPINRALFETWGTVLADYEENDIRKAAGDIVRRAREMMTSDSEFIDSISSATGTIRNVRTRFGKVREVVQEAVQ